MDQTPTAAPKRPRGRPRKTPIPPESTKKTVPSTPKQPGKPIDLNTLDFSWAPGPKASFLGEVFSKLPTFETDEQRVIWLRHNNSVSLRYVLQLAFSPIPWTVDDVSYKPYAGRRASAPVELTQELRRLYLYLDGSPLNATKQNKMFRELLESLDPIEAQLLKNLRLRTYDMYQMSRELIDVAYPGLLSLPFQTRFIR